MAGSTCCCDCTYYSCCYSAHEVSLELLCRHLQSLVDPLKEKLVRDSAENWSNLPLTTFRRYGSRLIVNGRKILKSETCRSPLCNCKNASNFRSSLSRSSKGAASLKQGSFGRTLKNFSNSVTNNPIKQQKLLTFHKVIATMSCRLNFRPLDHVREQSWRLLEATAQ